MLAAGTETVKAHFVRFAANDISQRLGSIFAPLTLAPDTCNVTPIPAGRVITDDASGAQPLVGSAGGLWLRAGEMTLSGNGQTVRMTGGLGSAYSGEISQTFEFPGVPAAPNLVTAGNWSLRGSGGADVGSFSADIDIQGLFKLARTTTSITRNQPLQIDWTGGGGDQDIVTIMLGSLSLGDPFTTKNVVVQCAARASSRGFTVPAEFTGALDPAGRVGFLWITSTVTNPAHFSAPLVGGGTLDGVSTTLVSEVNLQVPLK